MYLESDCNVLAIVSFRCLFHYIKLSKYVCLYRSLHSNKAIYANVSYSVWESWLWEYNISVYYFLLVLILVNNNSDLIFTVMLNFILTSAINICFYLHCNVNVHVSNAMTQNYSIKHSKSIKCLSITVSLGCLNSFNTLYFCGKCNATI